MKQLSSLRSMSKKLKVRSTSWLAISTVYYKSIDSVILLGSIFIDLFMKQLSLKMFGGVVSIRATVPFSFAGHSFITVAIILNLPWKILPLFLLKQASMSDSQITSLFLLNSKVVARARDMTLRIALLESFLYVRNFDNLDPSFRKPIVVRGQFYMTLTESAIIKSIKLCFRCRAKIDWPGGKVHGSLLRLSKLF